ncbi:hypothetical protein [Motiliproteus sp. MSK22-1]|uniref:hypothetical protein n=1 Tax=Motiliproteus sp. MSK22-1 TaxID=1897630 RepID=UPI000975377A|nr:hypothetical protein [Motiliproteus sp. MSK22-1]OMH39409.1 hypothetical protein BGP75_03625 [Motiliproteus sp. MSK22-1]
MTAQHTLKPALASPQDPEETISLDLYHARSIIMALAGNRQLDDMAQEDIAGCLDLVRIKLEEANQRLELTMASRMGVKDG